MSNLTDRPDHGKDGRQEQRLRYVIATVIGCAALLAIMHRFETGMNAMPSANLGRALAAAFTWMVPGGTGDGEAPALTLPAAPPTIIGVNPAEIRYYSSTVPFTNLLVGSEWNDSQWRRLGAEHLDSDGNVRSLGPDGTAHRFLMMPPTGPAGIKVRCTFTGSGTLSVSGLAGPIQSGPHSLDFRLVNERGKQPRPWIILKNIDPRHPPRDLDCREAGVDRAARFRPAFLATLRGYGVIRFMDWQNANANEAVSWDRRHTVASLDLDRDGVAVEDMLALVRELGSSAWFVMPWNADDDYITRFAELVRAQLPPGRSVYIEVGNEVWNGGFAVSKQAIAEGLARKLGTNEHEAGMRRYAERTVEVMRLWEAAFAGRPGLVRVLATQNAWPDTAKIALSYRDTARHVDALATAPYFGVTLGGTGNNREGVLKALAAEIPIAIKAAVANRSIAVGYGKRYIAYEGGIGVVLPAQVPLAERLQSDPAMYDLYYNYLDRWRREVGDVFSHYNSVFRPTAWGSWGLAAWEDESLAEAPKLRAMHEFMAKPQR